MNDEILEKYIIQHIGASSDDVIMFSWHGGEPLLAGLIFSERLLLSKRNIILKGREL